VSNRQNVPRWSWLEITVRTALFCVVGLSSPAAQGDDWPQWMGPKRDGVWRETGIVAKFPEGGPKIRWRVPIGGGYAGPAVVGGRVYVTDKQLAEGVTDPSNPFQRGEQPARERVLCLDDTDGKVLWSHIYDCPYTVSYPAGPRTTPVVAGEKLFTLGSEGHLFCLNAETGSVIWSKNFRTDYGREQSPVWGYAANPLLDGERLICLVGGEGTTVVAFDRDTGKEVWRALDSSGGHGPGYGNPIIVEAAGRRQLIVWHPQAVSSLDPVTGEVLWNHKFPIREGLTVAQPRVQGDLLFLTAFYDGSLLLKLKQDQPGVDVVWRRHGKSERNTDALHALITTPVIEGDHIYGACSYGEFRCLTLAKGDRIWQTFQPTSGESLRWGTAFIVRQADRYFLFSENGDLIIANLSPKGYEELSRAHLLEPTGPAQNRKVVWTHPAFANKNIYVRNDKEIVSASLAE
jgi:outer membrane protein assembly factor BamB